MTQIMLSALLWASQASAYTETHSFAQAEQLDANGRILVEESVIHVIYCDAAGENGGQYYVYEYMKRPGYRAILPPDWGHAIGGQDFDTYEEAAEAACYDGEPWRRGEPLRDAQAFRGQIGKQVDVLCEPGFQVGTVWGTDVYTDDSHICTAAVHAGLLTVESGGTVTIEIREGLSEYAASERNGILTSPWGGWGGSFVFVE